MENLLQPDRVIIGSSETIPGRRAAAALTKLYMGSIDRSKILSTHVWSSELAKLVSNAMLAQRISSINSVSQICEKTGAVVSEIATVVGADPRIGPQFLKAGLGFGGSCFRKDIKGLVYLAKSLGLDEVGEYWNQVLVINDLQRTRFTRKVISRLDGTLISKKITLLGFAFKKNTSDPRGSLAVDIIRILLDERPKEVAIFDPACSRLDIKRELEHLRNREAIEIYSDPYQVCLDTNAMLIVTDWDNFCTPFLPSSPKNSEQARQLDVTVCQGEASPAFTTDIYLPEPPCSPNCPDCAFFSLSPKFDANLDWARIACHMKRPKLVFDGRNVVNHAEIEKLGVFVEALGIAGCSVSYF